MPACVCVCACAEKAEVASHFNASSLKKANERRPPRRRRRHHRFFDMTRGPRVITKDEEVILPKFQDRACSEWKVPFLPVKPCTMTLVSLSTNTAGLWGCRGGTEKEERPAVRRTRRVCAPAEARHPAHPAAAPLT